MHRRILLLLLPALLAGFAAPAAAPAAAKRRVPQGFLGVNLNGPMLETGVDLAGESATMARAGAEAVRHGARVVLAGLNSGFGYLSWTDLGKVYAAGGGRLFDEAAQHPFSFRTANVIRSVRLFRAVMARHGDGRKPLLLTELSWTSA